MAKKLKEEFSHRIVDEHDGVADVVVEHFVDGLLVGTYPQTIPLLKGGSVGVAGDAAVEAVKEQLAEEG